MAKFSFKRRRLSFNEMTNRVPVVLDPLDFLNTGRTGSASRDAYQQIHGAIHGALGEVERSINSLFERLRPDGNISDRMVLEANADLRTELARANTIADVKRDEMVRNTVGRLERLFIQRLIVAPDQEPPTRRWSALADRAIRRDLTNVSEPNHDSLDVSPNERKKRLTKWQAETDEYLETVCLNHVGEVIKGLLEELNEYSMSWMELIVELKRHSNPGGRLFQEVSDSEFWSFDSDDPTVKNLLTGEQAQEISQRILNRFQLSNQDLTDIASTVYDSLAGRPVYGTNRVETLELEDLLAMATADKIRTTVSIDTGFLSLISNGARFGEELSELLVDMHMGAAAMEEKMWRVGEVRVGHVDSASGVGITASNLHDSVLRGLGGGRKFAAVEGHPGDNHRFEVQMSTVGAPISDLGIYRDMVNAWYSWHFEDVRSNVNGNGDASSWLTAVNKESWKLYPDIGEETGVRRAIIELIDDDLKKLWDGRGDIATRLTAGQFDAVDTMNGVVKPQDKVLFTADSDS
ncbi:MAG: hypothetical protein O3A93_14255 [Chloroflexi bacterium]|nr:hypothetical protein [Chloroflexota bacterium]MDA1272390.1 hypothetical protein [Chloroflexota bacterium]PKB58218.1 MAG: hypothetical protein BZY83_08230 [SAR202 cluster bacterium Casp-Chloro-G2]